MTLVVAMRLRTRQRHKGLDVDAARVSQLERIGQVAPAVGHEVALWNEAGVELGADPASSTGSQPMRTIPCHRSL